MALEGFLISVTGCDQAKKRKGHHMYKKPQRQARSCCLITKTKGHADTHDLLHPNWSHKTCPNYLGITIYRENKQLIQEAKDHPGAWKKVGEQMMKSEDT